MKLNGGLLGPINTTSNVVATGMWSLPEHYLKVQGNVWTPSGFGEGDLTYFARKTLRNLNGFFNVDAVEDIPTAFRFSADGYRAYVLGSSTDSVQQYTLLEPYNLETAFYSGNRLSIVAEDGTPSGLAFDVSGANVYITGTQRNNVLQYSLSVPWDISTGVFKANYHIPEALSGVAFSANGQYMYACLNTGDNVKQYTLSESWNVASANYNSIYFYVGTQETAPTDVVLNSTGSRMYVTGTVSDKVHQYNLSESWNVASATLASSSPTLIETTPQAVDIRPDESYVYVIGSGKRSVLSYALTTSGNVATATLQRSMNTFSVASQDTLPTAIRFNQDGTKMYMLGSTNSRLYVYTLSTPWNMSTATFTANTAQFLDLNGGAGGTNYTGLYVNPLETYVFITDFSNRDVYKYDIATPGNVASTRSFVSGGIQQLDYNVLNEISLSGVYASPDGTYLYAIGAQLDRVFQHRLAEPWNIGGASGNVSNLIVSSVSLNPNGLAFSPDGDRVLIPDSAFIYQFNILNPWDVSTGTYSASLLATAYATSPIGIDISSDGRYLYTVSQNDDIVYAFSLPDRGSLTPKALNETRLTSLLNFDTSIVSLKFNPSGNTLYVLGTTGDNVYQLSLTEPWDSRSLYSTGKQFNVATQEATPTSITFSTEGDKMYIAGSTGDDVNEYSLSTPFDVTTASYVRVFSVATEDNTPQSVKFKPDGTKMYVLGSQKDNVSQYSLTTPWNLSTATYDSQYYYVGTKSSNPATLEFNSSGNRMYVLDSTLCRLFQFELTERWNVASAYFNGVSANLRVFDSSITAVTFNDDYTKIYCAGSTSDKLYEVYIGP